MSISDIAENPAIVERAKAFLRSLRTLQQSLNAPPPMGLETLEDRTWVPVGNYENSMLMADAEALAKPLERLRLMPDAPYRF